MTDDKSKWWHGLLGSSVKDRPAQLPEQVGGRGMQPVDVHIEADDLDWLYGKMSGVGDSVVHGQNIRLTTTKGDLVFESDSEIRITWEDNDD